MALTDKMTESSSPVCKNNEGPRGLVSYLDKSITGTSSIFFKLVLYVCITNLLTLCSAERRDFSGRLCSERYPTVTNQCPVFLVSILKPDNSYKTNNEIIKECRVLGFATCPTYDPNENNPVQLFSDGECRRCPNTHSIVKEHKGQIWCEDNQGARLLFDTLACSQQQDQRYRACHKVDTAPSVALQHYYAADDTLKERTMEQCYKSVNGRKDFRVDVRLYSKTNTYHFPVVDHDGVKDFPYGYRQCRQDKAPVDYETPGWILVFVFFGGGTIFLLVFFLVRELYHRQYKTNINGLVAATMDGISMRGYNRFFFGTFSYYYLWALSFGWHAFLLVITLDEYGAFPRSWCVDQKWIADCDAGLVDKLGYTCTSACIFSWSSTRGYETSWPYLAVSGGVEHLYGCLLVFWTITAIWWVVLIAIKDRLEILFMFWHELSTANTVACTIRRSKNISLEKEERSVVMRISHGLERMRHTIFGVPTLCDLCKVSIDPVWNTRYFEFNSERYWWCEDIKQFRRAPYLGAEHVSFSFIVEKGAKGLTSEEVSKQRLYYGTNKIEVTVPNFFKDLASEYFTFFYHFQFMCVWIWLGFFYFRMGLVMSVVVSISGLVSVLVRRRANFQIKEMTDKLYPVEVLRDGVWQYVNNVDLVPLDVVSMHGGETMATDCIMVVGKSTVDESSLTGEPTPVIKTSVSQALADDASLKFVDFTCSESQKHILYAGTTIESASPGIVDRPNSMINTDNKARGLVISTGCQTERGWLIKSILCPAKFKFKFDAHLDVLFMVLFLYSIGLAIFTISIKDFSYVSIIYSIFVCSQVLPPLLPVLFVVGQAVCSYRLRKNSIFCVNLNRIFLSGKAKYFCFDKTGTLTMTGLDLYGTCVLATDRDKEIGLLLGSCHELELCNEKKSTNNYNTIGFNTYKFSNSNEPGSSSKSFADLRSDHIDEGWVHRLLSRFFGFLFKPFSRKHDEDSGRHKCVGVELGETTGFGEGDAKFLSDKSEDRDFVTPDNFRIISNKITREKHGKDDQMVEGNHVDKTMYESSDFKLRCRENEKPFIVDELTNETFSIVRRFEFTRTSMTMSVIVVDNQTGQPYVFTKGSYEGVVNICDPQSIHTDANEINRTLSKRGYYIVCLAFKKLPLDITDFINYKRADVEKDLELLGLLLFRNEVKPDSKDVIDQLKNGNIGCYMITGDNALTATYIARQVGIVVAPRLLVGTVSSNLEAGVIWTDASTDEICTTDNLPIIEIKQGNVELAVTGAVFQNLLAKQPQLVTDLLPYIKLFARTKPNDKADVVSLFMAQGITGMCGDGANDAAALRMAHCGLALASGTSEATTVAPFSTSHESLQVVPILISESRGALATALAGYKRLMLVQQTVVLLKTLFYVVRVLPGEGWWITVDCVMNLSLSWAVLQSKPAKKLRPYKPTSKLFNLETLGSVVTQILINLTFLFTLYGILWRQSFFECRSFDKRHANLSFWWTMSDNFETIVLSQCALMQVISSVIIFNFGLDFRVKWHKNYWPLTMWLIYVVFGIVLIFNGPSWLSCAYRYNCGDQSLLRWWTEEVSPPRLDYHGENIMAPPGCPCSSQVAHSKLCENEYRDCRSDAYHQFFHHNIVPTYFRWVIFGVVVINTVVSLFVQGFFFDGPVRKYLRKKRDEREKIKRDRALERQAVLETNTEAGED